MRPSIQGPHSAFQLELSIAIDGRKDALNRVPVSGSALTLLGRDIS